jgi:hypothetical protein
LSQFVRRSRHERLHSFAGVAAPNRNGGMNHRQVLKPRNRIFREALAEIAG